jgi:hypothetical protein
MIRYHDKVIRKIYVKSLRFVFTVHTLYAFLHIFLSVTFLMTHVAIFQKCNTGNISNGIFVILYKLTFSKWLRIIFIYFCTVIFDFLLHALRQTHELHQAVQNATP